MSDAPLRLRTALRLPRTYRWVSDWLFTNLSTPFHRNLTLPPNALQTALSLHAKHTISLPPTFFPLPIDVTDSCKAVDILFVPLAVYDSILVGYTLGLGALQPAEDVIPTNPFEPPMAGRFVFDTGGGEMLMVLQGDNPPVVGIMYMGGGGNGREQNTFAVPAYDYSFDHLPNTVLSMFSTYEHRVPDLSHVPVIDVTQPMSQSELVEQGVVASNPVTQPEQNPLELLDKLLGIPPEQLDGMFTPIPPTEPRSYLPWFVSPEGELSDGGAIMPHPHSGDTSSGAFCVKRLADAVCKLQHAASGKFYGASVRMDALHILTGRYISLHTGKIIYDVRQIERRSLTDAFATTYFMSVLDVAPDQRLLIEAEGAGEACNSNAVIIQEEIEAAREVRAEIGSGDSQGDVDLDELVVAGEGYLSGSGSGSASGSIVPLSPARRSRGGTDDLVPIAPAYVPKPVERPQTPPNETKEERRLRLAVERRKRNRLSAARSNMRKKEQLEAVKREIEQNWAYVKELKERKGVLMGENERLRRLVGVGGDAQK